MRENQNHLQGYTEPVQLFWEERKNMSSMCFRISVSSIVYCLHSLWPLSLGPQFSVPGVEHCTVQVFRFSCIQQAPHVDGPVRAPALCPCQELTSSVILWNNSFILGTELFFFFNPFVIVITQSFIQEFIKNTLLRSYYVPSTIAYALGRNMTLHTLEVKWIRCEE